MSRRRALTVYSVYILILCILRTQSMPQITDKDIDSKYTARNFENAADIKSAEKSDNEINEIAIPTEVASPNEISIDPHLIVNSSLTRIDANATKSPSFMVSIQIKENGKFKHQCGGTILSKNFVITAAHCMLKPKNLNVKRLYVVGGSQELFHKNATQFRVQTMKKHPNFIPLHGSDILLLKITPEIPIDNVYFSSLEFRDTTSKNDELNTMLIGWGRTQPNTPKDLESIPFRTISNDDCFINYNFKYLTNTEICAVNLGGSRGACDGDSGGPLIDINRQSLCGILSYGRKPCQSGKPYAFTRISVFVNWIEKEMENMLRLNVKKNNNV